MAEKLLQCGYPSELDGCAYIEATIERCMAHSLTAEKWEAVASCLDPEYEPESGMYSTPLCSDQLACIKGVEPGLVD